MPRSVPGMPREQPRWTSCSPSNADSPTDAARHSRRELPRRIRCGEPCTVVANGLLSSERGRRSPGWPRPCVRGGRAMGRGRAKAKQTKVARELKYSSPATDLEALQRELSGGNGNHSNEDDRADEAYADEYDERRR